MTEKAQRKRRLVPCQASWSDGECMLSEKNCPNPTPGDPSNCPREKANPRRTEDDDT